MAKKKTKSRPSKKAEGLLEAHPNLIWLGPTLLIAALLVLMLQK